MNLKQVSLIYRYSAELILDYVMYDITYYVQLLFIREILSTVLLIGVHRYRTLILCVRQVLHITLIVKGKLMQRTK